jgi:hypothetical protein
MKIELWICEICYRAEDEPWHGDQYSQDKQELAHTKSAHKWVQKCVERPDGSHMVLRHLCNQAEYNELLDVGNLANGVLPELVEEVRDGYSGPGWYFFTNADKDTPESVWTLHHIEEMRDSADDRVHAVEQTLERARIARTQVYDWVGKQNDVVPCPIDPEWPVDPEAEQQPAPVLP